LEYRPRRPANQGLSTNTYLFRANLIWAPRRHLDASAFRAAINSAG
jgi:hypothetical protein